MSVLPALRSPIIIILNLIIGYSLASSSIMLEPSMLSLLLSQTNGPLAITSVFDLLLAYVLFVSLGNITD
tara:strand:- start:285 stop:494 length:210 start_codon:yes stop_codon:yes gene_type:complete